MRVGSGKQLVRSHVARDLYFYLNIIIVVLLHLLF